MKKYLLIAVVIVFAAGLVWFGTLDQEAQDGLLEPAVQEEIQQPAESPATAQQAPLKEVQSVYEGVLPAVDCPGIQTTLTLYKDGSFQLNEVYLERDTAFTQQGSFKVENGVLTLLETGDTPRYFRLEENAAVMLTMDQKPITGALAAHYILRKK